MSNQRNKITTRTARPQTLAGAVGTLMRVFGVRASDADLVARWAQIMGPQIASIAVIAAIKKTRTGGYNVVLRPVNPAFALQLSYMSDDIAARINKYFGRDAVEKISFRK